MQETKTRRINYESIAINMLSKWVKLETVSFFDGTLGTHYRIHCIQSVYALKKSHECNSFKSFNDL
jgi:hypothetical protein